MNSGTRREAPRDGALPAGADPAEDRADVVTVATRMTFDAPAASAWEAILFYEQIERRPPLLLRLLLPVPRRTEGVKEKTGDCARCVYDRGHLVKRVTRVEQGLLFAFEVVEQQLRIGRGIRLLGGRYLLRAAGARRTEVTLETRYARPRWRGLFRKVEAAVCHAFHRHILGAMRRRSEARPLAAAR